LVLILILMQMNRRLIICSKTKDYKIGMYCFSARQPTLRRKSKDLLARNQDNVSEWCDMSIRGMSFQ